MGRQGLKEPGRHLGVQLFTKRRQTWLPEASGSPTWLEPGIYGSHQRRPQCPGMPDDKDVTAFTAFTGFIRPIMENCQGRVRSGACAWWGRLRF